MDSGEDRDTNPPYPTQQFSSRQFSSQEIVSKKSTDPILSVIGRDEQIEYMNCIVHVCHVCHVYRAIYIQFVQSIIRTIDQTTFLPSTTSLFWYTSPTLSKFPNIWHHASKYPMRIYVNPCFSQKTAHRRETSGPRCCGMDGNR
jgi:hypothetical protein